MDKFLKTYNLPRLNHEEIKNLNKPITSKEPEWVVTTSEQRKARLLHCKISEDILYKISEDNLSFKDKLTPILKLFWKTEKGALPNSFIRPALPWHQKSEKDAARKLWINILGEH